MIMDGKVFHGFSNSACEVGYMHMQDGAFQDLASTTALVEYVAAAHGDPVDQWNGRRIFKEATEGSKSLLINEVKEYILERIEKEDLTIDAIASHLKMSRTKFYNKWKSVTGEAPTVFIEAVRMEKAHELLESGKYPVGTIPEMIGLKDVKNFRNRYKEYFGITPKESIKKK